MRPTTVDEYIGAAPEVARPHLRRIREILAEAAPDAEQVIKWNAPFFVEPRFLFSFSALKHHAVLAPGTSAMEHFADELAEHVTTKNWLKMPYDEPLPEDLVRRIAEYCVASVAGRADDAFW